MFEKESMEDRTLSLSYTGMVQMGGSLGANVYLNYKNLMEELLRGEALPAAGEMAKAFFGEVQVTIRRLDKPLNISGSLEGVE